MQKTLTLFTKQKRELIDLTPQVEEFVAASGRRLGVCLVFVQHTTAALVINDVSESFGHDLLLALEQFPRLAYTHLHAARRPPST